LFSINSSFGVTLDKTDCGGTASDENNIETILNSTILNRILFCILTGEDERPFADKESQCPVS